MKYIYILSYKDEISYNDDYIKMKLYVGLQDETHSVLGN